MQTMYHINLGRDDISPPNAERFHSGFHRVMARSGVLTSGSSGDQIDLSYLDTVFELYSGYHLGQVVEAA